MDAVCDWRVIVIVIACIRRINISLISIQNCEGAYTVIIGVEFGTTEWFIDYPVQDP
jgi:hypothetical protein